MAVSGLRRFQPVKKLSEEDFNVSLASSRLVRSHHLVPQKGLDKDRLESIKMHPLS